MHFFLLVDASAARTHVTALIARSGDASHIGQIVMESFRKSLSDLRRSCRRTESCKIPKITYYDTRSDPKKACKLFKKMYAQGVRVFIGLVTSEEAQKVAEYASKNAQDAILVSPTSTATKLCQYKQLYRLTMDDRGYAEVLFDLAMDARTNKDREFQIQLVARNNAHGNGLVRDVRMRFKNEDKFKVLPPIFYEMSGLRSARLVNQVNSSLANRERSMIVFTGYTEVEGILAEAARVPELCQHMLLLSDSLTFSYIKTPDNINVMGLTFAGLSPDNVDTKREERDLQKHLCRKGLPLMKQALLAYDTITIVHNYLRINSLSSCEDKTLTGPIKFSNCNERLTGAYAFAVAPMKKKIDNMLVKLITNKWFVSSLYDIKQSEILLPATQNEGFNEDAEMEANLKSSKKNSITATDASVIEIKKKDLVKGLLDIGDRPCTQTATVQITSIEALDKTCSRTTLKYRVARMPEAIIFSDQLGFIMEATCMSGNFSYKLTRVCPASKSANTELVCTDKTTTKAIGKVSVDGILCTGVKIGRVACTASSIGCSIASIIPWFSTPCSAVRVGCGVVNRISAGACRR